MQLFPMGDYFIWYCDWCDSANHTHWSLVKRNGPSCAACHQPSGTSGSVNKMLQPYAA